jgi:hypothetical protein
MNNVNGEIELLIRRALEGASGAHPSVSRSATHREGVEA